MNHEGVNGRRADADRRIDVGRRIEVFRRAAVAVCALMLVAAGAYSFLYTGDREDVAEQASAIQTTDAVQAFIDERDSVRALETMQLNALSENEAADSSVRLAAQRMLLTLSEWMEQEATIEGVLRMRGYENAVATVHEDSVNVVISADSLTQSESAVILELVMRETGVTGGNIKIIPIGKSAPDA